MSSERELMTPEDTAVAGTEWTYDEIADNPALVAELQDCELRVGYAKRLQYEAHMEIARQIERASDAMKASGYSRDDFYRMGKARFGMESPRLTGYISALRNPHMEELSRYNEKVLSPSAFATLGTNFDQPDITHMVAIGAIPPNVNKIQQALTEAREAAREAAREEARQELDRLQQQVVEREDEFELLQKQIDDRERRLQEAEDAIEDRHERINQEIDAAVGHAVGEAAKELRKQWVENERQEVRDLREKVKDLAQAKKEDAERIKSLEARLTSTTDPENIRRKWKEAGESFVKELGRFNAALPSKEARLRFEGRDENLLDDIIRRMENLLPLLRDMRMVANMIDESGVRHMMITGSVVESE